VVGPVRVGFCTVTVLNAVGAAVAEFKPLVDKVGTPIITTPVPPGVAGGKVSVLGTVSWVFWTVTVLNAVVPGLVTPGVVAPAVIVGEGMPTITTPVPP
jgi:hypothetical protein